MQLHLSLSKIRLKETDWKQNVLEETELDTAEWLSKWTFKEIVWLIRLMHVKILSALLWCGRLRRLLCIIACLSVGCHGRLPGVCLIWITRTALGACYCPSWPKKKKKATPSTAGLCQLLHTKETLPMSLESTSKKQKKKKQFGFSWSSASSSLENHTEEELTWNIATTEAVRKVHQKLRFLMMLRGGTSLRKSLCPSTAPPCRPISVALQMLWGSKNLRGSETSEKIAGCALLSFLSSSPTFWVSAENQPFPSNLHISSTASSFTPTTFLLSLTLSTRLSAISVNAAEGQKPRWPGAAVPTAREAVKEPKTRALMDFRAAFSHCSTSAQCQ